MLEHKCEVCGRLCRKKLKADGKIVCIKHYNQFRKHKKFSDNSPRTVHDKNKIIIYGKVAYMELYNKKYEVIAKTVINTEDIDKIKNIKWNLNCNGYVANRTNTSILLHRVILGTNSIVDHINGNRLDNRKSNLRIATKSQNQMNVNYKGVYEVNNKYIAKIKLNGKQVHLGCFCYEEEALYARWYAERLLFKEFAYNKPCPQIIESRRKEIEKLVENKVQRLQ